MFSHIMVGTNDIDRAEKFYTKLLSTLGAGDPIPNESDSGHKRLFYMHNGGIFAVSEPIDDQPATAANGATVGFACESPEQVKAFHDAGVEAGGTSIEDPPGLRESSMGAMHLSYVRDPDGNKLCALHRVG